MDPGARISLLFVIIWLNTNLFSNMDHVNFDRGHLYKSGNAEPLSSLIIWFDIVQLTKLPQTAGHAFCSLRQNRLMHFKTLLTLSKALFRYRVLLLLQPRVHCFIYLFILAITGLANGQLTPILMKSTNLTKKKTIMKCFSAFLSFHKQTRHAVQSHG